LDKITNLLRATFLYASHILGFYFFISAKAAAKMLVKLNPYIEMSLISAGEEVNCRSLRFQQQLLYCPPEFLRLRHDSTAAGHSDLVSFQKITRQALLSTNKLFLFSNSVSFRVIIFRQNAMAEYFLV
jgi:hypothetical protein